MAGLDEFAEGVDSGEFDFSGPDGIVVVGSRVERGRFAGKTILVVDDKVANHTTLARVLSNQGATCICVTTEAACLVALHLHPEVDAIVMDMDIDTLGVEISGFDVAAKCKKDFPHIPIIQFTGKHEHPFEPELFFERLNKPPTREQILFLLSQIFPEV